MINDYIKKQERSQINNLPLYLKEIGRKMKLRVTRRMKITNIHFIIFLLNSISKETNGG